MRIYTYETINTLLEDTCVPNIFLELYLPHLSGDCVRVYLYAWTNARRGQVFSNEGIADKLGIPVEAVLSAWTELESEAVVRKIFHNEHDKLSFDIEFADLKGSMFAPEAKSARTKRPSDKAAARRLSDAGVKDLFREIEKIIGRPFPAGDYQKVAELLTEFEASAELVARAYGYCMDRGRNPSAAYVREIIREWTGKGIRTAKEADDHIEVVDMRFGIYRKIMRALGLSPQALTEAEKRVFDVWLDDYTMSADEILEVTQKAAGKQNKFDYVKKIIENNRARAGRSGGAASASAAMTGRKKYYAEKRRRNEEGAEQRRAEVIAALPRVPELEAGISRLNMELASLALSSLPGRDAEAARLSAEIDRLIAEKEKVMSSAGFAPDYMDIHYTCDLCRDTGTLDNGTSCRCFETAAVSE
ncbi:MAG: DnaD domain protein [Clostridiales Family XIII bacterium]|nr:DnaD domain protein [Clostridiales Family XIII bacterium]